MTIQPTRQSLHSQQMQQQILDTAAQLFRAYGYDAVGLRDIAAKIGVTTGALYHHFGSKEEILLQLGRVHEAELQTCIRAYSLRGPLADMIDFLSGPMVQIVLDDGLEVTRHRVFSIMAGVSRAPMHSRPPAGRRAFTAARRCSLQGRQSSGSSPRSSRWTR